MRMAAEAASYAHGEALWMDGGTGGGGWASGRGGSEDTMAFTAVAAAAAEAAMVTPDAWQEHHEPHGGDSRDEAKV